MKDFVAIDFETANRERTSICSVGLVRVENGDIREKIYCLIRPYPDYYSSWNTRIHGLTYRDTAHAAPFPEVWADISPELAGLPLVAHYSLNIFSEIQFYRLSLYISYLQMFSFGLNTHEISRF